MNSREEFKKHIDEIRRILIEAEKDAQNGIINRAFISKYIDKIYVTPVVWRDDPGAPSQMRMEIKIFTGETTEKHLSKIKSRTGHIFKKMIRDAENAMKNK